MTVLDTLNFVAFNPLANNNPTAPKDSERTDFTPIRPQPPLPNQQDDRDKR